jgi:hypothetical protein
MQALRLMRQSQAHLIYGAQSKSCSYEPRADSLRRHNHQSFGDFINVESPDSVAAQSGRFADMASSYSYTDFSANAYDQGLFDPFSAIDLPNFTIWKYNLAGDLGDVQEDNEAAAGHQT